MPACAVASRTPAMAGSCGVVLGASGEMMEDIFVVPGRGRCSSTVGLQHWDYGFRHSLRLAGMTLFYARRKGQSLLRRRGRIERGGIRLAGGLVEALNRCRFAQVVDKLGLGAARDVVLQLAFNLIICRRRLGALVFDP